jgi:hypothetical protein
MPSTTCLGCGRRLDCASRRDEAVPEPGSMSICWYCGYLAVFTEDLTLRPLTSREAAEVAQDPELQMMLKEREMAAGER